MSGSEEEFTGNEDVVAQELADSLKKMGKIVNNLMARADCVPFREPVDWKGLQVRGLKFNMVVISLFVRLYFILQTTVCTHGS